PEGPGRRHRAQLAGGRRALRQLVLVVAHGVVGDRVPVVGAVDSETVVQVFDGVADPLFVHRRSEEGRDAPFRGRPGADHVVFHGNRLAVAVQPDLDLLVGQGPGEVHLHVVFAGKDQLYRLADSLGRRDRRDDHVRLQTAPEAAAPGGLVHRAVLWIRTGTHR